MNSRSDEIKKVCVYGVGGVGGYFGGKIANKMNTTDDARYEVYFVARGEHLNVIKRNGITVVTPEGTFTGVPTLAGDDIRDVPTPDLFILCTKSYDSDQAVRAIRSKVIEKTLIIPLLNGADIYDRIRANLDEGVVLPACVFVGTHIEKPGVIRRSGGDGTILFGKDPKFPGFTPEKVMDLFTSAGINFIWNDDPFNAIWGKYIFIASYALVTVYTGKTLGEILEDKASIGLVQKIMIEIKSLAERKGIILSENVIEQSINKARDFPYETKTSYQRDVEMKGNVNEGDLYGGTIIREGKTLGIPTPITESIYSEIQRRLKG